MSVVGFIVVVFLCLWCSSVAVILCLCVYDFTRGVYGLLKCFQFLLPVVLWWDALRDFVVYSTRRFVVCLSVCHFVLVFFSPFSNVITSFGEERANLSAFRTFVRFVLVWICRFPLPLGVWEGLRFVIVGLPGLFFCLFFCYIYRENMLIKF